MTNNQFINKLESMVTKKNHFLAAIALLVAMTGLTSCLKNNVQPQKPFFYMAVINAAPLPYAIDAYINNAKSGSVNYKGGALFTPEPGMISLTLKPLNKDSVLDNELMPYDTLTYYTHLVYGNAPVRTYIIDETNNFTDQLSTTQANVRFYHTGVNIGAVDVYINDTKLFSSRGFEDFISAGGQLDKLTTTNSATIKVTVKLAGTDTVIATKDQVTLSSGGIYTMFLTGISGQTGDLAPAVNVLSHNT